jgi:hypothetical protein
MRLTAPQRKTELHAARVMYAHGNRGVRADHLPGFRVVQHTQHRVVLTPLIMTSLIAANHGDPWYACG